MTVASTFENFCSLISAYGCRVILILFFFLFPIGCLTNWLTDVSHHKTFCIIKCKHNEILWAKGIRMENFLYLRYTYSYKRKDESQAHVTNLTASHQFTGLITTAIGYLLHYSLPFFWFVNANKLCKCLKFLFISFFFLKFLYLHSFVCFLLF